MPTPLPEKQQIAVTHLNLPHKYHMDSMQSATDHYNIGFTLQGHRRTITSFSSFSYGVGDVALMAPYITHRTLSEYDEPYERIMIKFSPSFAEPFIREVGQHVFNRLYSSFVYHFTAASQAKLERLFRDILEEYQKDTPYKEFILQGMLFRLFTVVLEEHIPEKHTTHPTPLSSQIIDAIAYMEEHYAEQPSLEKTAAYVGFSAGYFSRLFHSQLDMTYSTYLNNIQLRHVQLLLSTTSKSIMEIAQETGYCHGEYLSAQFKKRTGITPSLYRKRCLASGETFYMTDT